MDATWTVEQDFSNGYSQHPEAFAQSQGQYPSQYQNYTNGTGYPNRSASQNNLYPHNIQQKPSVYGLEDHQRQQQQSNRVPNGTSFTNNHSFNGPSLSIPSNGFQAGTYNFQVPAGQSVAYDQSPNSNSFSLPSTDDVQQPAFHFGGPTTTHLPRPKRTRVESQFDESVGAEDEPEHSRGDHKDNQKGKPGACARCKSLKVRCELKTDTDPCKRCLNGGHECITPGRKKRRTPPKREHLLAEIQKQAETIEKLMAQLADAEAKRTHPQSSQSDVSGASSPPVISPSTSYFDEPSSQMNPEKTKVVEDWIVKARESFAEFGGLISMGGGLSKKLIVAEDPEDSSSDSDEEEDYVVEDDQDSVEIAVVDSEGEGSSPRQRMGNDRRKSTANSDASGEGVSQKKQPQLATLPSEAAPFGLLAKMSLKNRHEEHVSNVNGEEDATGPANTNFFRPSPARDIQRSEAKDVPQAPAILVKGVISPTEAEELFKLFFDTMNLSCSLVDPVLYSPQRTVHRSPFLFTVICAISSRFYTKRPGIYQQAMSYAQLAAGSSLIGGQKNVEMCIAYILMSLYPAPFKRWEDSRSYLYLGLAIRIAIELNLHLPPTAKPQNEFHAREQLNRTRVWINCFNLDRSTSSQYGKRPIISSIDYIANHTETWWCSSEYNLKNFDIQLCCYNAELKVMGKFIETIYSDPRHPTGLNKDLNFETVALQTDQELQELEKKWWPILDANVDKEDPQGVFRVGLLKLAYSYSRLIALSYGFQHAFGKNNSSNQDEKSFLIRCISAATDVIKSVVDYNNRQNSWIYVRHGPDAQSVFIVFAAAFLIKILQPKFAVHLDEAMREDVLQRIQSVINYLGSPQIGIDERYGPKMYAKFLKNLLASPVLSPGAIHRRKSSTRIKSSFASPTDSSNLFNHSAGGASNHASPSTTHSLSPPPSHEALSFDHFAPSNGSVDPFAPSPSFSVSALPSQYDGNGMDLGLEYFTGTPTSGAPLTEDEMIQNMSMSMQQPLSDPNQQWQVPGINWLAQFNFQNDAQMMYGQQYNTTSQS